MLSFFRSDKDKSNSVCEYMDVCTFKSAHGHYGSFHRKEMFYSPKALEKSISKECSNDFAYYITIWKDATDAEPLCGTYKTQIKYLCGKHVQKLEKGFEQDENLTSIRLIEFDFQ